MKQITDNLQNYPQILDGFVFTGLFGNRPLNGCSWYWNCLANLENLRAAAEDYRPRQWVVPKDFFNPANANNANIAPGKTVFYEFQVRPGSYLYGLTFAVFNDELSQARFSVVVRESRKEAGLSDRQLAASGFTAGSPVDPFNTLYPPMNLLSEPRLITSPGQIHAEVSNDSDPANVENAVSCQLLLLFAEPK
jgi:hypothetical protein